MLYWTDGTGAELGAIPSGTGWGGLSIYMKSDKSPRDSHGGNCCRFPSLKTRFNKTPTPSKTPKRMPQATAEPRADRGPPSKEHPSASSTRHAKIWITTHYVQPNTRQS